ncbi:hypothetical protein CEH05_07710 [Halobacillus halophilus]|nr:hypothetical protein [Halobacillus halophilus]ASF39003.1 hypothetical protein CEH05_07710 [Halobacillus halophilus]
MVKNIITGVAAASLVSTYSYHVSGTDMSTILVFYVAAFWFIASGLGLKALQKQLKWKKTYGVNLSVYSLAGGLIMIALLFGVHVFELASGGSLDALYFSDISSMFGTGVVCGFTYFHLHLLVSAAAAKIGSQYRYTESR